MKRWKRTASALLAVLIVAGCGLAAGCGGEETGSTEGTLLVDLHSYMPTKNTTPTPESPVVVQASRLIAEAYQKETGVAVKWADSKPTGGLTSEVSEWYINQIGGQRCPAVGFSWGTRFQDRDWYLDLGEYLERPNKYVAGNEHWWDLFPSYLWEDYEIRDAAGRIVAVPVTLNPGTAMGIYYNKEIFGAGNLSAPRNWTEYLSVMDAISDMGKTPLAPWTTFKYVGLDQWVMEYSLSPNFAAKLMATTDLDGDGTVTTLEELKAVKRGVFNPETSSAAKTLYGLAKTYYKNYLPSGWTSTDFTDKWDIGSIGMMENGLWNIQTENNKTTRTFDYGIFPAPMVDSATTSYAADTEWADIDTYKSRPSLMLNIMKPGVTRNGQIDQALVEQAVDFLMYLTIPDNVTMIVQEHGGSLGAVTGSTHNAILDDWLDQQFPSLPNCRWPLGYTTEYTSIINRRFAEWVSGKIDDKAFFKALNEAQQAGADDFIAKMGLTL